MSNVIIRGGQNIDPSRIESILGAHSDIEECVVLGVPSKLEGEQEVLAIIVPRHASSITPTNVKLYCREFLKGPRRSSHTCQISK